MSRTDKTRPYWVREQDRLDPAAHVDERYWGVNICGCKMCTASEEFKADRRRERHNKYKDINERLED